MSVSADLLSLAPVSALLGRVRAELGAGFVGDRPVRVSRAPGRLDVMGGIADYTGSVVLEMPLDRAAAVALQERGDRTCQVFSFNLLDEHVPFTLSIGYDALVGQSAAALRRGFAEPGRRWAGYLVGCLFVLHERGLIDLRDPRQAGVNLALFSTVPAGAGVSSSAAVEVATMLNLVDHFGVRERVDALAVAAMCQEVEQQIVGAPCGIMDQVASCAGEAGKLLRLRCQPHELMEPLALPEGVRVVGIDSGLRHSVAGAQYGRVRAAAFMGHAIIVERMREFGRRRGLALERDPLNGYLANLEPDDYKRLFRPGLPASMKGGEFLLAHGGTVDPCTVISPDEVYDVRSATDHHVLEAMRVRNFIGFIDQARGMSMDDPARRGVLDKAGHLMYASDFAYAHDAGLGSPECALIVEGVRRREGAGLYGARITGAGSGGTVAVLADASAPAEAAEAALGEIMEEYARQTGLKPALFEGSSPGGWWVGTAVVKV